MRAETVPSAVVGIASSSRTRVLEFDGIIDQVREARQACERFPEIAREFDITRGDWIGRQFYDWSQVEAAASGSWPEGMATLTKLLDELSKAQLPEPKVIRRRGRWSEDTGAEINLDRYREAEPYWWNIQRTPVHGSRVVTMLVQVTGDASQTCEQMTWKGALAIALARIIEDAGYRAEIIAFNISMGSYGDNANSFWSVPIKAASDAIDMGTLVNVISGWYFRTVGFGSFVIGGAVELGEGLGYPGYPSAKTVERLIGPGGKAWMLDDVWSFSQAVAKAKKLIPTLNQLDV